MGEVYLARDTKLDRDVALKLLPSQLANDADRLRRFELEARAASALNHPAIVAIYDLGQAESQPYFSMELVEGQTLRQILQAGPMQTRRALQVAAPIADGLAKAHEAGIVHRDLKPENLMVSRDGFAKILDFGLAKLVGDGEATADLQTVTEAGTRPGSVMGTVGYMSPEQAAGGTADNRSDQFSFGLVLYEMLTGRRAFSRPSAVETLAAIIRDDPPPIGQLNPSVPAPVRWIVDRCLAKNPADRYGSTRDLARDLASARDHFSELSGSGTTVTSATVPVRKSRRELFAWLLVGALVLTTIGLVVRQMREPLQAGRPAGAFHPRATKGRQLHVGTSHRRHSPSRPTGVIWCSPASALTEGAGSGSSRSIRSYHGRSPGLRARSVRSGRPTISPSRSLRTNQLKRVSIACGDVAIICEARFGGGGTWNRDGVIVFAPAIDTALFRVAATGGTPTPLTVLDPAHEESAHMGPLFLPDGRHFLFGIDWRRCGRHLRGVAGFI